jgi:hypothetical protein
MLHPDPNPVSGTGSGSGMHSSSGSAEAKSWVPGIPVLFHNIVRNEERRYGIHFKKWTINYRGTVFDNEIAPFFKIRTVSGFVNHLV